MKKLLLLILACLILTACNNHHILKESWDSSEQVNVILEDLKTDIPELTRHDAKEIYDIIYLKNNLKVLNEKDKYFASSKDKINKTMKYMSKKEKHLSEKYTDDYAKIRNYINEKVKK